MDVISEFYMEYLDVERFNYAHVVLIRKKEGASSVSNFRPISLLNVIYKIITKTLTQRLNSLLYNIIDKSQWFYTWKIYIGWNCCSLPYWMELLLHKS